MKRHPLMIDGLWQCLCPRFHTSYSRSPPFPLSRTSRTYHSAGKNTSHCRDKQIRNLVKSVRRYSSLQNPPYGETSFELNYASNAASTLEKQPLNDDLRTRMTDADASTYLTIRNLVSKTLPKDSPLRRLLGTSQLSELDTSNLYNILRTCAIRGYKRGVDLIAKLLVLHRNEKPNLKLYTSLIAVNVDPATGSAEEVAVLLKELSDHGLVADSAVYHGALSALAVHPDALLRGQILQDMQSSWLSLNEDGWHDVVAGCIKDGQMEQALQYMEEMLKTNIPIRAWLYQMVMYKLCDMNEIREATSFLKHTVSTGVLDVSPSVWYYVFDRACADLNYDAVQFIWNRRVELHHLAPSISQCTQALVVAARNSDAQLASDVFRVLSQRPDALESQHYEALIEAYLGIDDLKTAVAILCIMGRSEVEINERSMQPIHHFVTQEPERAREMFTILQDLRNGDREVPVGAFNCLLECSTGQLSLDEIVGQYKMLHRVCSSGPNVHTFNALFRACRIENRKDTAMFLAAEMVHLGIQPGPLTYDRLILVCMTDGSLDDAFRYLDEMRAVDLKPRAGTLSAMAKAFGELSQSQTWSVLRIMEECYGEAAAAKTKAWVHNQWKHVPDPTNVDIEQHNDMPQTANMYG